jgi:hypothetical protein
MFWLTDFFIQIIIGSTSWAQGVMRGEFSATYIKETEHAAY